MAEELPARSGRDPDPTPSVSGTRGERSIVAAVSRDIVRLHARFYGRGPTRAKTVWHDAILVCLLEDIFTKGERLLVKGGRFEDVRAQRIAFQDEAEPLFRAAVEANTGRGVRSFLGQISADGVACEVFVLGATVGPETPRREGAAGVLSG